MTEAGSPAPPRPRVLVNCAISLDGKLAYAGGARARLSGPDDLRRVQALRAACGAVLVGAGTVRHDDPSLRVHWELLGAPPGREPLRVILDSHEGIPERSRVLDGSRPTLLATPRDSRGRYPAGVEIWRSPGTRVELAPLLGHLAGKGVERLLVEGGATVLASFFRERLVDELTVYVAPVLIGGASAPSLLAGEECPDEARTIPLERTGVEPMDDGVLLRFRPRPRAASAAHPL
ncbi:MAG: dihydrofolate reductase family protein [Thermoplasmata archaeon]|nr:dihydrofolate reductase family protein [Thermoplasmata archaeon]